MTEALEGTQPDRPTFRDEANATRIGRARLIGHFIGIALLVGAIAVGLGLARFGEAHQVGKATVILPNSWVMLGASVVLVLALLDLGVRRRHDRGRRGLDVVLALLVLETAAAMALFGLFPELPRLALGVAAALAGLYLVVTLMLLPGARVINRYGPPPAGD